MANEQSRGTMLKMTLFRTIFLMGMCFWLSGCLRGPQVNPVFGKHLHGVWVRDNSLIWAVGAEGDILHSPDGSQTWRHQASGTRVPLQLIYGSGSDLWTVGPHGTILHSRDGGQTWTHQASGTEKALYTVHG